MQAEWDIEAPGVLQLPSGRRVRGRALRGPLPDGPLPEFGVYLQGRPLVALDWDSRWVRWSDFRVPSDPQDAYDALSETWVRAGRQRVEVACTGGRGRTGTALACLAILDGIRARDAVAFVRRHYHPRAVETPWQRRFVTRFRSLG